MTEAEWFDSDSPHAMLVFLRGAVSDEVVAGITCHHGPGGTIFPGPGTYIHAEVCRCFILQCLRRLGEWPVDEPSRRAIEAYRQYAQENASHDLFFEACEHLATAIQAGQPIAVSHLAAGFWTDEPFGAAYAANDIACSIAWLKNKESVAMLYAEATDDDLFEWGFSGPPDPLWQATRRYEEQIQASLLRATVGNPFRERGRF